MTLKNVKIPRQVLDNPQRQRMVMVCRLLRNTARSAKELTQITGISLTNIKQILHRIPEQGGKVERINLIDKLYRRDRQGSTYGYRVTKFPGTETPLFGAKTIPIYHNNRACKKCGGKLELSRWIECLTCKPELPLVDDDFIYEFTETNPSEMSYI